MAHNHPSGNVDPSEDDIAITEALTKTGRIINVPVIDHIIVCPVKGKFYSFHRDMFCGFGFY